MNPFDFVNSINDTKKDLIAEDPMCEKDYAPFIINKTLSYFYDTVFYANEMNRNHSLSKKMQYDFYLHSVSKKKRFAKWHKQKPIEDIELIAREYAYSKKKAEVVLDLFTKDQLDELKAKYSTGGK